jgi:hypothetical protein
VQNYEDESRGVYDPQKLLNNQPARKYHFDEINMFGTLYPYYENNKLVGFSYNIGTQTTINYIDPNKEDIILEYTTYNPHHESIYSEN